MITDLEIWRAASQLLKWKGEEAESYGEERIALLSGSGEEEGVAVWRRILAAVGELRRTKPRDGEAVN